MTEIERKFLVHVERLPKLNRPRQIRQAYLCLDPEVRARVSGEKAFVTIKGSGDIERAEYEYEVPLKDGLGLLQLSPYGPVEKTRYEVLVAGKIWEVDEYHGANSGLWTAEVELRERSERVELPGWVGAEITFDEKYKNKNLARYPVSKWTLGDSLPARSP